MIGRRGDARARIRDSSTTADTIAMQPRCDLWKRLRSAGPAVIALCALASCGDDGPGPPAPAWPTRTFRMGFSPIPPKPDIFVVFATLEMWTQRADAGILHVELPWDSLLAGVRADSLVRRDPLGVANYYRAKGLEVVVTLDATNGLDRTSEAPALVAAGRSLTEPEVQAAFRAYAVATDTILRPLYMGLVAETNLIRAATAFVGADSIYDAVVAVANAAAADIRAVDAGATLTVSVQVETAWGALQGTGIYEGIATDLADFPFAQAIGLSSYPYLGGFAEPDSVPLDYYARIAEEAARPVLVVEGGWTSVDVGGVLSSPEKQARYIRRHAALLDSARAVGVFQLTFADFDLSSLPPPIPPNLDFFAYLGLVDKDLAPKPALAMWDSLFALPLE